MSKSITCPYCRLTSHNPNDVRERYCGHCHLWIGPTPECPGCGQLPLYVLDAGRQALCGNDECHVMFWNPMMTLAQLAEDANFIKDPFDE